MRRILLIGFFSLVSTGLIDAASLEDNWIPVSSPTTRWLYRCTFIDTLYGWSVGELGTIIHSSNGGQNWTVQESPVGFFISDVFFINRNLGWAVSTGWPLESYILRTSNGGLNWISSRFPDSSVVLRSIFFIDSLNGFLGTEQHRIMKTTDGGLTWSPSWVIGGSCGGLPVKGFRLFNSTYGFAVGGAFAFAGVVWRTTNSGINWNAACVSPDMLCDLVFVDSLRIVGVGLHYNPPSLSFINSSDGGLTWIYHYYGGFAEYDARIARRTFPEFWIAPGYRSWVVSLDTARTWFPILAPDNRYLFDVLFKTPTFGIAVGTGGAIYKYNPAAVGIINFGNIASKNMLFQNFPNPFNPKTSVRYELIKHSLVRITVYNLLGEEVEVLVNEFRNAGSHTIEFNGSGYASGVYFFRIETGDFVDSKKMVLLR